MKKVKLIGLNRRGLLFTVMTLFLIFGIIALNEALNSAVLGYSPSVESVKLYSVSGAYHNASSLVLDVEKSGYAAASSGRVFPVSVFLDRDSNSFSLDENFSLDANAIPVMFDYLNVSKILLEDRDWSRGYLGVDVNVAVPKNGSWGGTESGVSFLIKPFCYGFTIVDANTSRFGYLAGASSCKAINFASIRQVDITITPLDSTIDFNSILCNGGACVAGPPIDGKYNVIINKAYCASSCGVTPASISIPIGITNNIVQIRGDLTPVLTLGFSGSDINFSYGSSQRVKISTLIYFNYRPEGFVVKDVNILAKWPSSGIKKQSS